MPTKKLFEQLSQFKGPGQLPEHVRALLASTLAKMNLVSREEFDAQAQVLARTRAKLEQLEAQLAELQKAEQNPPTQQE